MTRTIVEDGVGNKIFTDHWYGPPSDPNDEWGRIGYGDDGAQFFGYKESHSQFYATAPASTSNTATTPAAVIRWEKQEAWPGGESNHDPRAGKVKQVEVRTSNSGAVVAVTNYDWGTYRRSGGAWVATTKNRDTTNNSYPIIWTRLERSDTWTAGGAWSGSSFINGNGSGTQTRYSFDNTASYRGYGNIIEVQEYSHAETFLAKSAWDARVAAGTGLTQLRRTLTDYYPGTYVTAVPARVRIFDGGSCKSELRYIYDNVNGNYTTVPTAGILKKTEQPTNSCSGATTIGQYDGNWIITRLAHDSYGNVTALNRVGGATNGAQNIVIQTTYDNTYHRFPIEQWYSSNPAYKEYATYYGVNGLAVTDGKAFFGAMQEHCGVNEICTRQSYDEHGRPIHTWEGVARGSGWSSDATANLRRGYTAYGTSGWNRNVVTEWRSPRCYGNFVRKVYNGLGQLIQEQRPQENWSTNVDGCNPGSNSAEVDVNYGYDALGRQTKVSVPVGTSASYINRAAVWSQGETETIYDVAGRPARLYAPNDERTDYGYAGRSTAVFAMGRNGDPNQVSKWTEVDGRGHLVRLRTYNKPYSEGGTVQAEISLDHDVLGNLRTVTHPNGIGTTSMSYDLASRKTGMSDPDLGNWSYAYDRQGRLTRQTDARGKTICLYYNNLEQLLGKRFPTGTSCPTSGSYAVSYGYDAGHNSSNRSRGQLTAVASAGYNKTLTYNHFGALANEAVNISGASTYNTGYSYDSHLRPYATMYPDGEVVKVNFNSMGLPKLMCSAYLNTTHNEYWCDGNPWYVDNATYDEAGRMTQMQFPASGNLWLKQNYYSWTAINSTFPGNGNGRLQYTYIGTNPGWTNRLNLTYYYDSFGNVEQHYDNSGYYGFSYDHQNRLISGYGKSYSYDTSGRMTSYEGTSQPVNNNFPAHAIKKSGYTYDANGNLKTRYGRTLTWNHENRLKQITGLGTDEFYVYDDQGIRVKKSAGNDTTYYINQFYEVLQSGGVQAATLASNEEVANLDLLPPNPGVEAPVVISGTLDSHIDLAPMPSPATVPSQHDENSPDGYLPSEAAGEPSNGAATVTAASSNHFCSGQTTPGSTNWQVHSSYGIYVDVNTSACGFAQTPVYITTLGGNSSHWLTAGATSIYLATATGFRVYVYNLGGTITPALANQRGWHIDWQAAPKAQDTEGICAGQTTAGSTNWQVHTSNGIYLDVDTSSCGAGVTPDYTTSLGGYGSHWTTTGATSIYQATATGFRVYVYNLGGNITPAVANQSGWHINWHAPVITPARPKSCVGQTPPGNTNWQVYNSYSLYLDVDTRSCAAGATPQYVTALGGSANHWKTSGATSVYQPTSTGFRVYVNYRNGTITPAQANTWQWHINWRIASEKVVTKYYHFNGQRIAMKQNGVISYLHSDHLGSTVAVTGAGGGLYEGQKYYAYGKQRQGGALPTDHLYTGQKYDNTGLYYYNARYYDPSIGAFISPDTIVPDHEVGAKRHPALVSDYNRYLYVRGNPLNMIDPSGHTGIAIHDSNDGPAPEWIDWEELYAYQPDQLSGEMFLWLEAHQDLNHIAAMTEMLVSYFGEGHGVISQFERTFAQSFAGAELRELLQPEVYGEAALLAGMILSQVGLTSSEGRPTVGMVDCSFRANTSVTTQDGLEPIVEVKNGALVLAYNEALDQIGYYTVTATMAHVDPVIVLLTLDEEVIETTPEHPFYVRQSAPWLALGSTTGRWIPAGELAVGDLVQQADGTTGIVQNIAVVEQPQLMYNLTVAEAHTFFVGDGQWLVHNQCPFSNSTLRANSQVADKNNFTRAGRALQKHAARAGSPWQPYKPVGKLNPSNYNSTADQLVDNMLSDPATKVTTRNHFSFGNLYEFRAPDGRGLRYDSSGNFIGFLD